MYHFGIVNSPLVLQNINLTIMRGERIGIVGSTGVVKVPLLVINGIINPMKAKYLLTVSN